MFAGCVIISNMKKFMKVISGVLLTVFLIAIATGCGGKGIVPGKTYHLYTYDSKGDRFVKMGTSIRFGDGMETFEYDFGDGDLTIIGTTEHTESPNSYIISCSEEMIPLVTERYKKYLTDSGADQQTLDLYDAITKNFTARTQYFVYENHLFSGSAVELFREAGKDSDSFEGIYRTDDSDETLRLRGGYMYTQDEAGEYTVKKGYYTVKRGILTLISLDEEGKEVVVDGVPYRKRYLMAKITIPEEGILLETSLDEQLDSSAFIKQINAEFSDYSGKTIAVLAEQFFSEEMK